MHLQPAMLVSWGMRAVYIGPGFQLDAHRNAVAVLALALNSPMRIALDAGDTAKGFRICRSALIEPNALHLIATNSDDYAFIYVDALSHDLATLRAQCQHRGDTVSFDLVQEHAVISLLAHMPRTSTSWMSIQAALASSLGFAVHQRDARIATVVQALLQHSDDSRDAQAWAQEVRLSSSRFQHLFKNSTGLSFRRFRLWARMRAALACVMRGATLTDAALQAGLASSAHLSTAFKEMFGITPSQLIAVSPLYIES